MARLEFEKKRWRIERYPKTTNKTLQAWSAADELMLKQAQSLELENKHILLLHDLFGALTCSLSDYKTTTVIHLQSQLKAIRNNLAHNNLRPSELKWNQVLKLDAEPADIVLLKMPKSTDLFHLYLDQIHQKLGENSVVVCGFMTRYFAPSWVDIASTYFEEVEQSKAEKKARLLILKKPKKEVPKYPMFHSVKNNLNLNLKQYAGVFSSAKVDPATEVLAQHIPDIKKGNRVLDLACGNGVLAAYIQATKVECEMHALDDNYLAIASAKLNLGKDKTQFHWSNTINALNATKFDLIVCNPPFHFENENTIEIAITLFREATNHLSENGEFILVANTHLNYKTHLVKLFSKVAQLEVSGKYEVISCKL